MLFIAYMGKAYPSEGERFREWKKMAKNAGIPIVENPDLARERHARMMAVVQAELGGGLDG